jgi:hypothetical protein
MQTVDEVRRIADDWGRNIAPKDMIQNEKNAGLLTSYCLNQSGAVTAGGLTQAYNALRAHLDLFKEPTKAEIAAKLEAKMRKDYADSIAPQTTLGRQKDNQTKADADKKDALAKELKSVLSQIESEINGYTKGHASGVTDYSGTESGRSTLRSVRDQHDRRGINGAKIALDAVRAAKFKL